MKIGSFIAGAGITLIAGTIGLVYLRTQGIDPVGKCARHIVGGPLPKNADEDDDYVSLTTSRGTSEENP